MHVRTPPEAPRAEYVGCKRFLLTFCCNDRQPHFANPENFAPARDEILRTAAEYEVAIPVYCFMPDHLHLVTLGLSGTANTFEFVRIAKQRTSFEFKQRRHALLWQPGWHDRVIRPRDDLTSFVRYVIENPVHAGLVADPADCPYTGSGTMSRDALFSPCSADL